MFALEVATTATSIPRTFEKLATPLISTIKNANFIVNTPTFPLLDAVLIRVDYVLRFRERAVMK